MINRYLGIAVYITAALAMGTGERAYAQQASATSAGGDQLSEIVVTARRVEERLQDVPISISVFNQAQLEDRNITNIQELATYTPSLSAPSIFGVNNATFAIRGFVEANGTTPSVGVFFADVAATHTQGQLGGGNGAGPGDFFDLASVQVLKGPQGTLFGRNTTGGDILLVPQKPTSEFGGYVEQSVGNFDMERTQAAVNAPLNEQIRFRLAVDHQTRQGYLDNISGIGPSHFDDVDYTAVRGSMVIDILPNLENYTIASYSESTTNGDYSKAFGYQGTSALTNLLINIPAQIQATSGHFWTIENGNPYARQDIHQSRIINTTTWSATDLVTLKNIASYSRFQELYNSNIDGENGAPGSLPIAPGSINYVVSVNAQPGKLNTSEQAATEELQLQGRTHDSRLKYQSGVYFEINSPLGGFQGSEANILLNCVNPYALQCTDVIGRAIRAEGFVGSIANSTTEYRFRDLGIYSQASYLLTDQLTLTAGVRYTKDESSGLSQVASVNFPAADTPRYTCAFPSPLTQGGTSAQIEANPALCNFRAQENSHAPTWTIDLEYKPVDSTMLYVKESRGYRQGNVNVSQYGLDSWNPEKIDAYEAGAKTAFADVVHGTVDVAAFYNNFTHQQLALNSIACTAAQLGTPQCPFIPAPAAGIGNAGKSRIEGIEVDSSIVPFAGARLDFGYTYLDTKLLSVDPPPPPLGFTSVGFAANLGGPLPFTPKHKFALTAGYTLPLAASLGTIAPSATYTYQTKQFNTITAPPGFQTLSSQANLNLNLNWDNMFGHSLDLALFATNITNRRIILASSGNTKSFGYDDAYLNLPAMYGARLKYRF